MKSLSLSLFAAIIVTGAIVSQAPASIINPYTKTYVPNDADLGDLDHSKFYTWGLESDWPDDAKPVSATLTFKNIRNWDNNANVLRVHLLGNPAKLGVVVGTDNEGGGDNFAGKGVLLVTYRNLTTHANTLTYNFTASELQSLQQYGADGKFGLGFDPDCHYYNDKIQLTVCFEPQLGVPEPATLLLLAGGAVPAFLKRRRRA